MRPKNERAGVPLSRLLPSPPIPIGRGFLLQLRLFQRRRQQALRLSRFRLGKHGKNAVPLRKADSSIRRQCSNFSKWRQSSASTRQSFKQKNGNGINSAPQRESLHLDMPLDAGLKEEGHPEDCLGVQLADWSITLI